MSRVLFPNIFRRFAAPFMIAAISLISLPLTSKAEVKELHGVVSRIDVEPDDAIPLKELISLIEIKEGSTYSRNAVKKGVKLLYLKGGFSDISVDAEEVDGKILLTFRFTLKERVGEVRFSGNMDISDRRLRDILTLEEWDELSIKMVERQALAIKEFYRKKGYQRCEVRFDLLMSPGVKKVDIDFIITEGGRAPISKILLKGNKALSEKQLMDILPLKTGEMYDEERVLKGSDRMERFYRKRGYPGARVISRSDYNPERNEMEISFSINEGEREGEKIRVEEVAFRGNTAVSSRDLRRQMLTGRVFNEETFAADMEAVEFLYRKSGYLAARVTEKTMRYNEEGTSVSIEVTVSEGPRTMIKGAEVEGNYIFGREELLKEAGLRVGTPFDPWAVDDSILRISSLYFRKGYIYARVSYKEEFTDDRSGVVLRYAINEGFPVRVGRIVIQGNNFTRDEVIRRELLVRPGDPYNPEAIFKSQQRVYRLGYLSNVRLRAIDEDIVEERKDLLLSVKERKAGAFEFGAGYGTEERFRGFAELSHRNLFGTGAGARLRGDVSQLENTYLLGFNKPWLFDLPVDGRFSLVDQVTRRESYSLEKYAAIAGLDKDLTEFVKGSIQYEYEISRPFDVDEGAKIAPEDEGSTDIGTISPIIVRDSRDNPFNPRSGSVNSVKVDYSAGMATGSEVEFVKYVIQSSWYVPLSKMVVWGLSGRGGWAEGYGETKEIPISKRFFLGGRTTVRGFELDSIGPKGPDGSPTGGDAYLNLNTELRFPIYKRIGGLVFVDAGNVWLKSEEDVNAADLRSSAGIGLRYLTPIGPLSLDVGWKLDREREESASEWHFTIGNVF